MKDENEQLEALADIRKMMKESSKFLSLSGLSGVFAGLYALTGAGIGYYVMQNYISHPENSYEHNAYSAALVSAIAICLGVLLMSIATALVMSAKKAGRTKQKLFDHTSKKVFWSMTVPLCAGGLFCISLIYHGAILLVSPVMLLFYGMALLNSSKYTIHDIRYLAYLEIALGLLAAFYPGQGLLFWSLGFGVLHIIYGTIMWFKYDRQQ